jgi:hypothetical protein
MRERRLLADGRIKTDALYFRPIIIPWRSSNFVTFRPVPRPYVWHAITDIIVPEIVWRDEPIGIMSLFHGSHEVLEIREFAPDVVQAGVIGMAMPGRSASSRRLGFIQESGRGGGEALEFASSRAALGASKFLMTVLAVEPRFSRVAPMSARRVGP